MSLLDLLHLDPFLVVIFVLVEKVVVVFVLVALKVFVNLLVLFG